MKKISVVRMIFLVGLYSIFANLAHPIEPTIYTNLGFHNYMFGVAMAAMSLTNFLFAPFWGKVMDRYGCANITGLSFFGYSFAQYLFAISKTELTMTLARLLAGVFLSTISVSQLLYVMRYSPPEKTNRYLMYTATTSAVISPVGYLIGGVLGDYSIHGTMMVQVVGLAVIGVLFFLILGDETPTKKASYKMTFWDVNPMRSFSEIGPYLNAMLIVFFGVALLTNFASICYEHSFNYLIKEEYGFPPSYNGMLKALVGIVALISNATICSYLMKKSNIQKSTIGVLAICAVMCFGIVVIKDVTLFILINVVFFGFNSVYLPLVQATLTQMANKEEYGIFVGVFNAIRSVGAVAGSLVAGFAYEVHSRLPFAVTAVLFVVSVVCAWVNYRQFQKSKVTAA